MAVTEVCLSSARSSKITDPDCKFYERKLQVIPVHSGMRLRLGVLLLFS